MIKSSACFLVLCKGHFPSVKMTLSIKLVYVHRRKENARLSREAEEEQRREVEVNAATAQVL